jgi:hypothetical protein
MKKKGIIFIGSILLLVVIYLNREILQIAYAKLFRRDIVLQHHNNQNKLDGNFSVYSNGYLALTAHYVNGSREGILTQYYNNGQIKSKVMLKNDMMNGSDTGYYENGILEYTTPYWNNKYHGSGYHYSENGKLTNYNGLGLNEPFCLVKYDDNGNVTQILGSVIGSKIYSYGSSPDSALILVDKQQYRGISDLCVTVATPPKLRPNIQVNINNRLYSNRDIENNTVKIKEAFREAGVYNLKITGKFIDQGGKTVKADTLIEQITKE